MDRVPGGYEVFTPGASKDAEDRHHFPRADWHPHHHQHERRHAAILRVLLSPAGAPDHDIFPAQVPTVGGACASQTPGRRADAFSLCQL